jgi:hypothetical protein
MYEGSTTEVRMMNLKNAGFHARHGPVFNVPGVTCQVLEVVRVAWSYQSHG